MAASPYGWWCWWRLLVHYCRRGWKLHRAPPRCALFHRDWCGCNLCCDRCFLHLFALHQWGKPPSYCSFLDRWAWVVGSLCWVEIECLEEHIATIAAYRVDWCGQSQRESRCVLSQARLWVDVLSENLWLPPHRRLCPSQDSQRFSLCWTPQRYSFFAPAPTYSIVPYPWKGIGQWNHILY